MAMFKIFRTAVGLLALAAGLLTAAPSQGATGDRLSTAETLSVKSEGLKTVTLVDEYDTDIGEYTGYAVYYIKVSLIAGQAYTFWSKFTDAQIDDFMSLRVVDKNDLTGGESLWSDFTPSSDWDGNTRLTIESGDWDTDETVAGKSYDYYVIIDGGQDDIGKSASFGYAPAVVEDTSVPTGSSNKPLVLTMGTTTNSVTGTIYEDGYYVKMSLVAGQKYVLEGFGGTAEQPVTISYDVGQELAEPEKRVISGLAADGVGYTLVPSVSGEYGYKFVNPASSTVRIVYGAIPARLPADHPSTAVTPGAAAFEIVPGKMVEDNGWYDQVIDRCLFSFTGIAGHRYCVETQGADVDLHVSAYGADGQFLKAEEQSANVFSTDFGGGDIRLCFTVPADGTYYFGICEDIDENKEVSGLPVNVRFFDIDATVFARDAADPADDVHTGATALSPVLTAEVGAQPQTILPAGDENARNRTLSSGDWQDWYAVAARAGLEYRLGFSGTKADLLKVEVFTIDGSAETNAVAVTESSGYCSFTPSVHAMHYLRVRTKGALGREVGPYTVHACAYAADADQYGFVRVEAKPSSIVGATWRLTSGTTGTEPDYPFGQVVPLKGTVGITGSLVSDFADPVEQQVSVKAGVEQEVVCVYNDVYDPGDNAKSGAVSLSFSTSETGTVARTLWASEDPQANDPADWFSFRTSAGSHYFFVLPMEGREGQPILRLEGEAGDVRAEGESFEYIATNSETVAVCASSGDGNDAAYRFQFWEEEVGSVQWWSDNVSVRKDADSVTLTVQRSDSQKRIRVKWGTYAGTAEPGKDYSPASGELEWSDGDSGDKTVTIPLLTPARPVCEGEKTFYVRMQAMDETELGDDERQTYVEGATVATVRLTDTTYSENVGTLGGVSYGDDKKSFDDAKEPSFSVAPGAAVKVWVSRTDGSNGRVGVTATPVDGTAALGEDYFGEAPQTLLWESQESELKCVGFVTSAGIASVKTFRIRLDALTGDGYGVPELSPRWITVTIDPALAPEPSVEGLKLAVGTFRGVLGTSNPEEDGSAGLALVELSAAESSLSATVRIADESIRFSGSGYTLTDKGAVAVLSNEVTVGTSTRWDTLSLFVENLSEEDLSLGTPPSFGEALLLLNAEDASGFPTEKAYSGELFRDCTSLNASKTLLTPFAGSYTVGLLPAETVPDYEPRGYGYLTFTISSDGSVRVSGKTSGGNNISDSTFAEPVGSAAYPSELAVSIPVWEYGSQSDTLVGGVLRLALENGIPVIAGDDFLEACDDESSTRYGDTGYVRFLTPVGGRWDSSVSVRSLLSNREEWLEIGGATVGVPEATRYLSSDGTFSGRLDDGRDYCGVILMNRSVSGPSAAEGALALGYVLSPVTVTRGTWTDSLTLAVKTRAVQPAEENWGIFSRLTFLGNGNTAGSVPEEVRMTVGSAVVLPGASPGFAKDGFEFAGWRDASGGVYLEGDVLAMPVFDSQMTALWSYPRADVIAALGTGTGLRDFALTGDAAWFAQDDFVFEAGRSALRSGKIGANGQSVLEATADGPGLVKFVWAASSEAGCDKVSFAIDGVAVTNISGDVGWTSCAVSVPEGTHRISWMYAKDAGSDSGEDCAWLSNVSFGPSIVVTFSDPEGWSGRDDFTGEYVIGQQFGKDLPMLECATKTMVGWEAAGEVVTGETLVPATNCLFTAVWGPKKWKVSFDPNGGSGYPIDDIQDYEKTTVTLPDPVSWTYSGREFSKWKDEDGAFYEAGASYKIGVGDTTMLAQWVLSVRDVDVAFDCPGRKFTADGDEGWYSQEEVVKVGVSALRSGAVTDNGKSILETVVETNTASLVSFWWKVSSEERYDKLNFYVDDMTAAVTNISGAVDWSLCQWPLSAGRHTLRWEYAKDSSGSSGEDAAWIDGFTYGPTAELSFDPMDPSLAASKRLCVVGAALGPLPEPELATADFDCWVDGEDKVWTAEDLMPAENLALFARWKALPTIAEALGADLNFETTGTDGKGWLVTKTHPDEAEKSGKWCVRSGAIENYGWSELSGSVSGTGTLTFRCATSSEANYDKLTFALDGVKSDEWTWSGTGDGWREIEVRIATKGEHTLNWTYAKDGSSASGKDCAWIEQIAWMPDGVDFTITWVEAITNVCYSIDGATYVEIDAIGTPSRSVTVSGVAGAGSTVKVSAQAKEWYLVGGTRSLTLAASGNVLELTAEAVDPQSDIRDSTRTATEIADDLNVTNSNFRGTDESARESLARGVEWATTSGSLEALNAVAFTQNEGGSFDAANAAAEAYLLDCELTPEALEKAKSAFAVATFDPSDPLSMATEGGKGQSDRYGNGQIEIWGSEGLNIPFVRLDATALGYSFFRFKLVR